MAKSKLLKPPKNKWIKAKAVKFNRNGTVSVKAVGKVKANPALFSRRYKFWTDGGDRKDIYAYDLRSAAEKASKRISLREWRDGAWGYVKGPEGQMKVPSRA